MRRGPELRRRQSVVRYVFTFPPHLITSLIVGVLLLATITWRLSLWWAQDSSSVGNGSASIAFVLNALLVLGYLVLAIHALRTTPRKHW